MTYAFLASNTTNKCHDGAVGVNAEFCKDGVFCSIENRARLPQLRINAIEYHVNAVGFDARICVQDRVLHACRHGNHSIRVFHSVLFRPAGHLITAAQLFTFPRTVRLQ